MRNLCLLLLLGYFLAGCAPKYPTLFENPVCEPPCWQNITPGVTTYQDALTRLEKIYPGDKQVTDHTQSPIGFDDEIRFSPYNDFSLTGYMDISNNGVSSIGFEIDSKYSGIKLDHSIELFGEPQNILLIQSGEFDQVTLINAKKGTALGYKLFGNQSVTSAEISSDVEIREIDFFDPNQYQLILNSGYFSAGLLSSDQIINALHPWNGYGSFRDKYWPPASH